jgi:hypothetical protein
MPPKLEYHVPVRHSLPASVALFSLLALLSVPNIGAQINSTPTAATSQGFGGSHPITAPFPMGGTLPGHQVQTTSSSRVTFSTSNSTSSPSHGDGHHHHQAGDHPLLYAYPVPYAVDLGAAEDRSGDDSDAATDNSDANYQGGPTIFDRRGAGADSYVPPEKNLRPAHSADYAGAASEPDPPQEPTILIYKDGRKIEVGNYAIVGATLFDLTPGRSRKVPLADLDLQATQKQNDDRGVTFQIPQLPQAN